MSKVPTKLQFSAGGVAFRKQDGRIDVALISVGADDRWQLPKGLVDKGESTEDAALREVREEAGIDTEIVTRIDKVEYWYFWKKTASESAITSSFTSTCSASRQATCGTTTMR